MVSFQRDELGRKRVAQQALDHAARIRAAVDVIAERHGESIGDRIAFVLPRDLADDAIEQVGAAVNVADDVEPAAFGQWRAGIHTRMLYVPSRNASSRL